MQGITYDLRDLEIEDTGLEIVNPTIQTWTNPE